MGIALTISQSPYTLVAQKWKKTGTWTSCVMVLASLPTQLEAKPSRRQRLVCLSMGPVLRSGWVHSNEAARGCGVGGRCRVGGNEAV